MRFSLRIFFGYFLLVSLLAAYVLSLVKEEIKPAVRQSSEEVLVDTANLLAELIQPDFVAGRLDDGRFARAMQQFAARNPQAKVWGVDRNKTFLRVYVTDAKGIVKLDSSGQSIGQDYSQWRDVLLTLRGEYGARSTLADAKDPLSTIMHVAAPIKDGEKIIGVLTVARPNWAMQPFIERSEGKLWRAGLVLLIVGLGIGALFSWWLSHGITRLTRFAQDVSAGQAAPVPRFVANRELTSLATALGAMRDQLDGKTYIENYVHELTHELKSPLAGIRASAEILHDDLAAADKTRFLQHIDTEVARMQHIVDYLLQLASLEARNELQDTQIINLHELITLQIDALRSQADERTVELDVLETGFVLGEAFLLGQALRNVLQNAIDFTQRDGKICIQLKHTSNGIGWQVNIYNDGKPIPDYALNRLFDRFYSLPRPNGQKSTGLGLVLTRTIIQLHGGQIQIANAEQGGVIVRIELPTA
ncbi:MULTISPECIES: two-component system sensor histidine kinase CreC [Deefgea]|uniref:histidine kinase n=1 Tax=Deefgea chitinilytica TaxID=570276 RepID=A0ABS2CC53_9NEIS|nr:MULTISPECIES: two-component system sensor histidine kinase CreC [Deefgea]MBM5571662.1 two-component system sensor histidine kinase CreC [Deefgea chitinilytica]MBM9888897.1 two-component system sensor histidine kinase CreC [Deefgea sp. CFH1-16]